jgi:hypothetical protein
MAHPIVLKLRDNLPVDTECEFFAAKPMKGDKMTWEAGMAERAIFAPSSIC